MNNNEFAWYANLDKLPSPDVYICDYDWTQRYNDLYWFCENHLFDSYCDVNIWKQTEWNGELKDKTIILLSADKDNNSHTCICDGLEKIAETITHDFALNPLKTRWYYSYTHLLYPFYHEGGIEERLSYSTVEFDREELERNRFLYPTVKRSGFYGLYQDICVPF